MNTLISRSYSGAADLQAMIELAQALRRSGQTIYPIAADLYEELADLDVQATARLWENDGRQLAGFAYVNRYQNLVDVFDAGEFTPAIETELLAWIVTAVQRRNWETGVSQVLAAGALESDRPRRAFLERNGFERQAETSILMACPLDQPILDPQLPAGFIIRPMDGEAEINAYVALHLGTHPTYQRLGLAKALIMTGMRLLKARGMDTALLGTSSKNAVMQHTAEAIGFRSVSNTLWYYLAAD